MSNNITTLEQSRKLAALGYPQDEWPQMVWERTGRQLQEGWVTDWTINARPYDPSRAITASLKVEWIAAPDVLTALEWLEKKGWTWEACLDPDIGPDRYWQAYGPTKYGPHTYHIPHPERGESPITTASALLDAILEEVEASSRRIYASSENDI